MGKGVAAHRPGPSDRQACRGAAAKGSAGLGTLGRGDPWGRPRSPLTPAGPATRFRGEAHQPLISMPEPLSSSAADAKQGFRFNDSVDTLGPCHAPFVSFADLGSFVGGYRPERSRHRRDGPRPGPADPRWRGWSRLRRRGASRRRLRPGRARARSPCSCGSRGRRPGRTRFRRRGASRRRLRAAGHRALNSWSRQVRHADPGWPPQLLYTRPQFAPAGLSLPGNPLGQLRQTQHLHSIGQRERYRYQ